MGLDFGQIVQVLGVPAAMLVVALLAGMQGRWAWGYLLVEEQKRTLKGEQDCERDLAVVRADGDRRIAETLAGFERERSVWITRLAEKDAQVAEQREQVETLLAHVRTYTEVVRETKRREGA